MLYRAPVDTSPVTEGVPLFKHQLLLNAAPASDFLHDCYPRKSIFRPVYKTLL